MEVISYKKFLEDIRKKCSNPEYARYIADFVQQGVNTGIITQKNLHYVLTKLQKIDMFTELPLQNRGIFGATVSSQNRNGLTVYINPDLDEHRRRQYAFHELAHVVMHGEQNVVKNNVISTMNGNISNNDLELIGDGFTVVEEAIAQEISEIFVYSSENRKRPNVVQTIDRAIPNISFWTNHNFYGLYQPIVTSFAKTLRGIGDKRDIAANQSVHLKLLCGRAFEGNFAQGIIDEYTKDNHYVDLIKNLKDMGNVYRVKQATFGIQNGVALTPSNLNISSQAYRRALHSFNMLKDERPRREI